jgi:hypothetical protein
MPWSVTTKPARQTAGNTCANCGYYNAAAGSADYDGFCQWFPSRVWPAEVRAQKGDSSADALSRVWNNYWCAQWRPAADPAPGLMLIAAAYTATVLATGPGTLVRFVSTFPGNRNLVLYDALTADPAKRICTIQGPVAVVSVPLGLKFTTGLTMSYTGTNGECVLSWEQ